MNRINQQEYSHFGLKVSSIEGVLDMPSRLGDVFYDWGDYIEPLVHEKDIFWKDRDIKVNVFFDGRISDMVLEDCLTLLKGLPSDFLFETDYGSFNVKLKQVLKTKGFTEKYAKLKLVFNENIPSFSNVPIGNPIGGNGINVDGYDFFRDFGILVSDVKLNDDIPGLKQSNITVFNTSKPLSPHRTIKKMQMSCSIPFNSPLQLKEAIGRFKKILSQSGIREVFYKGRGYSCFLSEGFNVKFYGRNLVKFNLRLNIATNFVGLRFVESGFITGA